MELKITKEKVLEAAKNCSTAAATLKLLFPEAFESKIQIVTGIGINYDTFGKGVIAVDKGKDGFLIATDDKSPYFWLSKFYKWEIKHGSDYHTLTPKYI